MSYLPIVLPKILESSFHSFHLYVIKVKKNHRDKIINYLKKNDIHVGIHYRYSLNKMPISKKFLTDIKYHSQKIPDTIISLPIYESMPLSHAKLVVRNMKNFYESLWDLKKFKQLNYIKINQKNRGDLQIYNFNQFPVKRIFNIYGNKNESRGNHAHKETNQIFICLKGEVKIALSVKNITKNFNLDQFSKPLLVYPRVWTKITFKKRGILSVICDKKYIKSDYIYDFKEI